MRNKKVGDICACFAEKINCFNSECYNEKVRNCIDIEISEINAAYDLLIQNIDIICEVYSNFLSLGLMNDKAVNDNLNSIICEAGMVYEAIGYY